MNSLTEIKNQFAQEQGYEDWEVFINDQPSYKIEYYMNEICIRAQKAALEKAAENADLISITNPENLIR